MPLDLAPDELTTEKAEELLALPSGDHPLGTNPETGLEIVAKTGRYGPYVTEVLPEGAPKSAKPRTASLFSDMAVDTVDLDDALQLLSLPRDVGADPADGVIITAQNGRYGPYLTKDKDSRSLPSEESIFTVTLEEALALLRAAQAAPGPGSAQAAASSSASTRRRSKRGPAQGRPLRALRHRRRDQRFAAPRRRPVDAVHRACLRPARREAGRGPGAEEEGGEEGTRQEDGEEDHQEDGGEEVDRDEDRGCRDDRVLTVDR